MITETSAVAFRQNLGEMINQVQFRKDSIVITKDGRPVAALIDAQLFERIRRMQERFDALSARIAEAYANVPEEEGIAEIKHIAAEVRAEMKAERARPKASSKRREG
jgi:prevent-host-death family protein